MTGGTIDFASTRQNGAWLVGADDLATLARAAQADGLAVARVELAGCADKRELLRRIAAALVFPGTFGVNWDALADCLADLGWLPTTAGYAWLFAHAGDVRTASPGDFATLCEILDDACRRWNARGTRCFAFLAVPDAVFDAR